MHCAKTAVRKLRNFQATQSPFLSISPYHSYHSCSFHPRYVNPPIFHGKTSLRCFHETHPRPTSPKRNAQDLSSPVKTGPIDINKLLDPSDLRERMAPDIFPSVATGIDFNKPFDPSNLRDKTVLVTGGASGLGAAIVLRLSELGYHARRCPRKRTQSTNTICSSIPERASQSPT